MIEEVDIAEAVSQAIMGVRQDKAFTIARDHLLNDATGADFADHLHAVTLNMASDAALTALARHRTRAAAQSDFLEEALRKISSGRSSVTECAVIARQALASLNAGEAGR